MSRTNMVSPVLCSGLQHVCLRYLLMARNLHSAKFERHAPQSSRSCRMGSVEEVGLLHEEAYCRGLNKYQHSDPILYSYSIAYHKYTSQ